MNELTLQVEATAEVAQACINSIKPELDQDIHGRSNVEITYDKKLTLHISAKDLHALRAATNTYLRWLDMCVKLAK